LISESPKPTLDDLLPHLEHMIQIGGIDCIAIGPDLMENWDPSIFTTVSARSSTVYSIPVSPTPYFYPAGMQSNADLPNLTEAMLRRGYSEADVTKFLGGNLMRIFDTVWKPRAAA
jgi:membrane dipeptidase